MPHLKGGGRQAELQARETSTGSRNLPPIPEEARIDEEDVPVIPPPRDSPAPQATGNGAGTPTNVVQPQRVPNPLGISANTNGGTSATSVFHGPADDTIGADHGLLPAGHRPSHPANPGPYGALPYPQHAPQPVNGAYQHDDSMPGGQSFDMQWQPSTGTNPAHPYLPLPPGSFINPNAVPQQNHQLTHERRQPSISYRASSREPSPFTQPGNGSRVLNTYDQVMQHAATNERRQPSISHRAPSREPSPFASMAQPGLTSRGMRAGGNDMGQELIPVPATEVMKVIMGEDGVMYYVRPLGS